jgi:transposase
MPRAYSVDLRERLLRAEAAGLSAAEIERTTGISARTLRRWRHRQALGHALVPGHAPGRPRIIGPDQEAALQAQVAAHPDATLAEHCAQWTADHGQVVSPPTLCRTLRRLGLVRQKRV